MQVTRDYAVFQPVIITITDKSELDAINKALAYFVDNSDPSRPEIDKARDIWHELPND